MPTRKSVESRVMRASIAAVDLKADCHILKHNLDRMWHNVLESGRGPYTTLRLSEVRDLHKAMACIEIQLEETKKRIARLDRLVGKPTS